MAYFVQALACCKEVSATSRIVIDEFLVNHVAAREGLEQEMEQRLARFKKVASGFQKSWINLIKAQYICHRIFKEGGLIHKYLTHAAVKSLPLEQQIFLQLQSAVAWRYSFSTITANPEPDFYDMEDAFSGESYLLYSPSITQIRSEQSIALWFNLIAFNGYCWQTFGPVLPFRSFEPDDIFFFASELRSNIRSEDDLMADVEKNPIPYLMLISGSNYPFTVHGEDIILQVIADHRLETFESGKFRKDFVLEYAHGVYKLVPSTWGEPPHFAAAYYDEQKKILLLSALTDRGFDALASRLNDHGLNIPDEPDIRLHISMLSTINNVLGKELQLNPYEKLFEGKSTASEKETTDKLNRLLGLALPYMNAGQELDVETLAREAGVDVDMARDLLSQSMGRIKTLRDQMNKK